MIFRKTLSSAFFILLFVFTACDNSPSTGPDETDVVIPSENFESARQYAIEDNPGQALIVWHDGEILYEHYRGQFNGQELHSIWSGSKSFAGLLAAIAVKNGLFTFETTLSQLIPEWDPDSERGKITIRQLLNLTSGIETDNVGSIGDPTPTSERWLAADMEFERGSTFTYGPTPFYILSWIFVEVFGENPINYLDKHLFSPLGVVTGEWESVDFKYPNLAFGGNYPALDWLQIGIMLKNRGTIDNTEIIAAELLDELLTPSEANPGYGITFWLNKPLGFQKRSAMDLPDHAKNQTTNKLISDLMPEDLYMMSGLFGQKLYICPSLNLVIVRFGVLFGNISDEEFFARLMEGVDQTTLE